MISLALAVMVSTGAVNPACTIDDVCQPGYTQTVRPPASYTDKLKRQQMAALGLPGDPSEYEEDHQIALEACGDPTDPNNLTPQLWSEARKKDVVETRLHRCICSGKTDLVQAQKILKEDWKSEYVRIKEGKRCP